MAHRTVHLAWLVALLSASSTQQEQTRWSRQISSYTSDISDWVPLPGPIKRETPHSRPLPPIKRQAVAEPRILTEPFPGFTRPTGFGPDGFPSRAYFNAPANRQLFLQSVPSAPQNYLSDQGFGQSIRFGLSQPNFPLSQGFISPQFAFDNIPAGPPLKQRLQQQLPQNPIKYDTFPKQGLPLQQTKPFIGQPVKTKLDQPKLVDGYRVENFTNDFSYNPKKKVQSLQKIKFESFDKSPEIETIASKPKVEREEVQLLYVPVESLNRGQFNFRNPISQPQTLNSGLYSQSLPKPNPLKQAFSNEMQKPLAKPIDTFGNNRDYFSNYDAIKDDQVPKVSTISSPFPTLPPITPKPKKLKPHQPPLAIFMIQDARKRNQLKVGDVLSSLKNANTIAVLDTVNPQNAPKVFIGPSTLNPPESFVKFELPYLSNIENSDKKLRQLPFFVAPLSYNTPNGFAKIPFPSPHVGSVVINSLIKDSGSQAHSAFSTHSTQAASVIPNSYTATPQQQKVTTQQQQKVLTQKPNFSYYSTASPNNNPQPNQRQQSNYYSIEPQTVTAVPPQKQPENNLNAVPPKPGSYFLSNIDNQYNPMKYVNFPAQQEPVNQYNFAKPETSTTPRTTVSTSKTEQPSTYSSQLLETHNPYSINQAFHFSTPLDYHSYYDELKDPYANQGVAQPPKISSTPSAPSSTIQPAPEVVTEQQNYQQQSSPNYLQNYSPEIHYESEVTNSRYPVYNTNDYAVKTEVSSENYQSVKQPSAVPVQPVEQPAYNSNQQVSSHESVEYNPPANQNLTETIINKITGYADNNQQPPPYEQYETNYQSEDTQYSSSTTSSTTTTTRRTPLRTRGRPKYTTARTSAESGESSTTRAPITRRPLRERRPLPSRSKYEPNKITTEKATRKPLDSGESTTKSLRTRTRGRIHYKPSENDDHYNKRNKGHGTKQEDLAYQRDVLHQNYPVTLMERMSTVDIEAMTEPSPKSSSTKNFENGAEAYDTENAYAHQSASISYLDNTGSREEAPVYTSDTESQTETTYVSKFPSTRNEQYIYETRSSAAPVQAIASYEDVVDEKQEDNSKQTTPEVVSFVTERTSSSFEQNLPNYSVNNEYSTNKQEEPETTKGVESTKVSSQETQETDTEENIVQTTPSYNRVRVRPGVIRQYHQASSTDSSRTKVERKKVQAVTYRPAFDRRRTTMRIEEIEADLKTKQVHSRPDFQDYKHPVYKPEPSTEPAVTTASTYDGTTKRGHFRRRRPVYTTTSTEASNSKKNTYETKSRFRGRRPTEKPTEKSEVQSETTTSTVRNTPHNRYSHRPRLSDRYNKKTDKTTEETEDQESNHSINRPKYVAPDNDQWSPKLSLESFRPYNPNNIDDDSKQSTTELKTDGAALDIITARNDYEDILISVTPATNTRTVKKIPDIPPTLEALVEQSKTTKTDSTDSMSTFETMLEEVMKSLEEQDEDEYTSNVMKHKGGEIGEIPPERVITSGDENTQKTTVTEQEITTIASTDEESTGLKKEQIDRKGHRRGYWKKVKVRPVSTETIETAESQYYANTVNHLGEVVASSKNNHDKLINHDKPKVSITTYKPNNIQHIKDFFGTDDENLEDVIPTVEIPKINKISTELGIYETQPIEEVKEITTEKPTSPGEVDLGTGSPDPTMMDSMYYSTPTEPTSSESVMAILDRSDGFSFMDYLFGSTAAGNQKDENKNDTNETEKMTQRSEIEITTEQIKCKAATTEINYIPEEITTVADDNIDTAADFTDIQRIINDRNGTTESINIETSSTSSFMNPANVVSTSMSTEVSHETEICFRGKCIKTNKDIL